MKSNNTSRTAESSTPEGFQRLKGLFILDFLPVMTRNQVVNVLDTYTLVEFKEDYGIEYRTVMFWHAMLRDQFLKIIVYDISNEVLITKLHDIRPEVTETTDWFLIDDYVLEKLNAGS